MPVPVVPRLLMTVVAAGRNELVQNGRQILLQSWLELNGTDCRRAPTLKTFTVPVWIPEVFTTEATCSVRSCMSPCPLVVTEICC